MQNTMHGDLLGSKSPSFIFDGPDGVGMDGILSDSNDSSSSNTENGLNSLMYSTNDVVMNNNNQLIGQQHSVFHQVHHTMHSNGSDAMQSHHAHLVQSEKRKHEDSIAPSDANAHSNGQCHQVMEVPTKKLPAANGKKTKGRVKIKMEFIDNKLRRYTTFSKRKTGIMKKAYELSTLTGTQVMLLVASETGHVYTFATRKLQPMITSEAGKALIQTCLNSPDLPTGTDQRMCATGFEETDLTYTVNEDSSEKMSNGYASSSSLFVDSPLGSFALDNGQYNNAANVRLPPFCTL